MTRPSDMPEDWLALEFTVAHEQAGWRADLFIANKIPRLSRTRVQKILRRSAFDSGGRAVKPNRLLHEGETITIYRPPPDEPNVPRFFNVVWEDEYILAVNKPPGLPVHPTARYHKNTLTGLLQEEYGEDRPKLAHRIDSETSGLIICTKNRTVERSIKLLFANRRISKTYLAICRGIPDPPSGKIEESLGPDLGGPIRVKMAVRKDGLPSLTEYTLLKNIGDTTALLECRPRTGRQHQIRAHLAHIEHPIIGDKMYGPDELLFLDYLENGPSDELFQRAGAPRHFLHSFSLEFRHPVSEKQMRIEVPIPDDMSDYISINSTPKNKIIRS